MMVEEDKDPTTSSSFPSEVIPDSNFLYQNSVTGEISKVPLSVTQLCPILCPPGKAAPLRHLNASTNVLLLKPDGSYSKAGWKPAHQVPVLREAVTLWYYHTASTSRRTASSTSSEAVSCRELAALLDGTESSSSSSNNNNSLNKIQVSSALTNSEWKPLSELPHLQTALQVLTDHESSSKQEPIQQQSTSNEDDNCNVSYQEKHDELEHFLKSTEKLAGGGDQQDDENGESYESDGVTPYVRDPRTGNWVHHDVYVAPPAAQTKKRSAATATAAATNNSTAQSESKVSSSSNSNSSSKRNDNSTTNKRKSKKAKFSSKKARCWVYVTGLPTDCTADEVATVFGKAGLLDLDEETQRPKIKLYRDKATGRLKGDASICYARPESVPLAITLLDDAPFRLADAAKDSATKLKVEAAKFEQHGDTFDDSRRLKRTTVSAKRKVVKLAAQQALDWDDVGLEANGRLTGGRKGLRIIVLKHLFDPKQFQNDDGADEDRFLQALEHSLRTRCEEWGVVEKMTVFAHNPQGVVVVKFAEPGSASEAVRELDGSEWEGKRIEAMFWDGVTDFTVKDEVKEAKEEEKRHEEFGNWLESQEDLPEELQLKTE